MSVTLNMAVYLIPFMISTQIQVVLARVARQLTFKLHCKFIYSGSLECLVDILFFYKMIAESDICSLHGDGKAVLMSKMKLWKL